MHTRHILLTHNVEATAYNTLFLSLHLAPSLCSLSSRPVGRPAAFSVEEGRKFDREQEPRIQCRQRLYDGGVSSSTRATTVPHGLFVTCCSSFGAVPYHDEFSCPLRQRQSLPFCCGVGELDCWSSWVCEVPFLLVL